MNKYKILITGGNGNIATILKKNLDSNYIIISPNRQELDLENYDMVNEYMSDKTFDICFHTAIVGGRRTKEESYDVYYKNMIMFENLIKFSNKFKIIFNMDSGAIYDRKTDIFNRKENELYTIPIDYYGFSKYSIYQRSLNYSNIYNFRIFNIFHPNEEPDRFIKLALTKEEITIGEDKFFDFFYYKDFVKLVEYYISNINNTHLLERTINICYKQKYRLSEVAKMVNPDINLIVLKKNSNNNYTGSSDLIYDLDVDFLEMEESIKDYKKIFN